MQLAKIAKAIVERCDVIAREFNTGVEAVKHLNWLTFRKAEKFFLCQSLSKLLKVIGSEIERRILDGNEQGVRGPF
jgi:hypothetical protein